VGTDELDGNQPSSTAKTTSRITPLTNSGSAMSDRPLIEIVRSCHRPWCSAATTPMKIENGTISAKANAARISELPKRLSTSGRTSTLSTGDVPQSPVA
jgi:hypothetical protein